MQPGQYYPDDQHPDRLDGGLYGNYQNNLPNDHPHMVQAAAQSSQILPRDAEGNAVPDGKIGLISIGMSNTRAEFLKFMRNANADPLRSSAVVLVNGAQNGQTAEQWARADDESWTYLASFVAAAGLTPAQVQVVWMKLTHIAPQPGRDDFPVFVNAFRGNMAIIAQLVKQRYPNVRLIYLSSRIYAGYSLAPLSPEPFAYEGAFSNRLLIDDQIAGGGLTGINYDNAPVLLWGPYLWADGVDPNSQGLQWDCSDLTEDGVHPSSTGISKVADRLLEFFKTDPLASVWFANLPLATATFTPTAIASATPSATPAASPAAPGAQHLPVVLKPLLPGSDSTPAPGPALLPTASTGPPD